MQLRVQSWGRHPSLPVPSYALASHKWLLEVVVSLIRVGGQPASGCLCPVLLLCDLVLVQQEGTPDLCLLRHSPEKVGAGGPLWFPTGGAAAPLLPGTPLQDGTWSQTLPRRGRSVCQGSSQVHSTLLGISWAGTLCWAQGQRVSPPGQQFGGSLSCNWPGFSPAGLAVGHSGSVSGN